MKMPKPIIPVHTCELGGHQSISHTSQQNRVPLEPLNLLCGRLKAVATKPAGFRKTLAACCGELGSRARPLGRRREKRIHAIIPTTMELAL